MKNGRIINGGRAPTAGFGQLDFLGPARRRAGCGGYIESTVGVAAGATTGMAAAVVGLLFLGVMFFSPPLAGLVPPYATAPALMYVGLLMLSNVTQAAYRTMWSTRCRVSCARSLSCSRRTS